MPAHNDLMAAAENLAKDFIAEGMAGSILFRHVEWVDTDASGHQHNSLVIRFAEAAEAKLFRTLQLPEYFPMAPRVRQEIEFKTKMYFGEPVVTAIRVDRIGRTSMTFSFKLWAVDALAEDVRVAANGVLISACVPYGASASQPWPASVRTAIENKPCDTQ